ncbi:MAG: hypothetical protein RI957_1277 [Verrucomicrobiota bacterium]|jgi:hypothetical protein
MIILRKKTETTRLRTLITALSCVGVLVLAQEAPLQVEVATKPGAKWVAMDTQSLAAFTNGHVIAEDNNLSPYGGLTSRREKATGFFRTAQIDGRWWLVDPEGCLFLHRGVSSVNRLTTDAARAAFERKFHTTEGWAESTTALLRDHGFNGLGAWTDTDHMRAVKQPLVSTKIWNFMSSYGKKRGGTYQKPGHTGYPNDCMFVFDPEFETFCDEHARQLAKDRDDPWLLGHFSDNELPFKEDALKKFLALPAHESGHQTAWKWLRARRGEKITAKDIKSSDQSAFLEFMAERYFRIVAASIKKHDPNHLYLGSRFHGSALRLPEIFRAAGRHADVISVNYYHAWTPDAKRLDMWSREANKPVIITEWYAKGVDSGMGNTSGAGWLVKTQRDRGLFYENFTLGLLSSKSCVGWHWFKYIDNDPADRKADPSNTDSNKGMLSNRYEPYRPLLESMKAINSRAYGIIDRFDHRTAR